MKLTVSSKFKKERKLNIEFKSLNKVYYKKIITRQEN